MTKKALNLKLNVTREAMQQAHHTLQERLAELHLYEEINQYYAQCNSGAENLRDWVAERMDIEPVQPEAWPHEDMAYRPGGLTPPEQEPVAWHTEDHLTDRTATTYSKDMVYRWQGKGWPITPLYTTPPQRPWVGLTEEEQIQVAFACGCMSADWLDFARAIEAKLREKNA